MYNPWSSRKLILLIIAFVLFGLAAGGLTASCAPDNGQPDRNDTTGTFVAVADQIIGR